MIVKNSLGEAASVKIPGTNKKDPVIHGHGISQKAAEGKGRSEEVRSSGVAGVQELQECRSSGGAGAMGKEHDLLVLLHAPVLEQFKEAAFGFLV
ncbi:MAG: hypothetical protein JO207_08830, partial [Verrucomicrobia bacterium]|nr:hypothetical protein [Verrucomicrobiota bacterium]